MIRGDLPVEDQLGKERKEEIGQREDGGQREETHSYIVNFI